MRNVVDLPQPDGPSSTQKAPSGTLSDRSWRTGRSPNALLTCSISIIGGATIAARASQQEIGRQGEPDGRQRAEQNQIGGILAEPLEDEAAEPAGADQRRHHREPDRLHDDDAQPGQEQRHCQRQLDLPEQLAPAHAHAARRIDAAGSTPASPATALRTTGSSA